MNNSISFPPKNQANVLSHLDLGAVPNSYLELLATYNNSSENDVFSKAYERNSKIFWNSKAFFDFLLYAGAEDVGLPNLERLLGCGLQWGEQEHKRDKRLRYYPHGCGDTCLCGRCAPAKSRQRASHALNVFRELAKSVSNNGIKLKSKGLEVELTIPRWLSEEFCKSSNRGELRQWVDRFSQVGNRAIKRWFNEMGIEGEIAGVNVLHFWKSGAPWIPHVHSHFVLAPVCLFPFFKKKVLCPLPRWYEERDLDRLRRIWKEELEKEFGQGISEELNVYVNYLKRFRMINSERKGKAKKASSVEFRLNYMFRSPLKDFARCIKRYLGNGNFEVEMIPEGAASNKERIKGIVSYSELRNFVDLLDAFSAPRKRKKEFVRRASQSVVSVEGDVVWVKPVELKLRKKTPFEEWDYQREKKKAEDKMKRIRENRPGLYEKIVTKKSKRLGKGKGGLERIRWFGFLAKRNLGEFFESINITKEKVESEWEDTGRQLEFVKKTGSVVELLDKETGEFIEISLLLMSAKPLNIGGNKWVWKYGGNKGSP